MMAGVFTRKELYDLVSSAPLRTLAKESNISDAGLAKICRGANIPLPGVGRWAKRAFGKPTRQPALPPRGLGQHDGVSVGGRRASHISMSDQDVVRSAIPAPPSFTEDLAEVTARARKIIGHVPKTASLKQPHPLIAKLLEEDERRRQAVLKSSWHWDKPM
jgi:hypothetical protein